MVLKLPEPPGRTGKTCRIATNLREQPNYMVQTLEMSALPRWIQKCPDGPLKLPEPPGTGKTCRIAEDYMDTLSSYAFIYW